MVSTVTFGEVFMSTPGSTMPATGGDRLSPLRQRSDLEFGLDIVYRRVVGWAIGLGSANDPDVRRRRVDSNYTRR
jgi:hypothetical protein